MHEADINFSQPVGSIVGFIKVVLRECTLFHKTHTAHGRRRVGTEAEEKVRVEEERKYPRAIFSPKKGG